jgi:hypothetical protein
MSRIAFVVNLKEFNKIRNGLQSSIFREKRAILTKRLQKDYDLIEIRNGVMANRPKLFFEFVGFEELENEYRINLGKKVREENMRDDFKLVGEKL